MPRTGRGRTTRSTRSPATFALDGHLIETYNHIDDLPRLSNLPRKRPRHATRGATAAERRADRQAAASDPPQPTPNGIVTRSSRQNLLRQSTSPSPPSAPTPPSEPTDTDQPPISCRVCLKSTTSRKIICCSICRKGSHTFCLNPPVMDLPNDAAWKCVKCRKARLPLKKEARIILRDALNSYSTLCTDKYLNSVANIVCVVSDSESPDNKKNPKTSIKANAPLSSNPRGTENTVILRVSPDDSDMDSDVDADIQPTPIANSTKPRRRRSPDSVQPNPRPAPQPIKSESASQSLVPLAEITPKQHPLPSSPDVDDERPLSEFMSRSAKRRNRLSRIARAKETEATRVSPKQRLKAKHRSIREAAFENFSSPTSKLKSPTDPGNLPIKRRGRKPQGSTTDDGTTHQAEPMDEETQKGAAAQKTTDKHHVRNENRNPDPARTGSAVDAGPDKVKQESRRQKLVDGASGSSGENRKRPDPPIDVSEASGSYADEGYPGDTEDDLPLAKRSIRYRKGSPSAKRKETKPKTTASSADETELAKNQDPARDQVVEDRNLSPVPKKEAVIVRASTTSDGPTDSIMPANSTSGNWNPSTSNRSIDANPVSERQKKSGEWPEIGADPKREALFALARVQRQPPKAGDSSGRLSASFDGESSGRLTKLVSRTENVPESERQRIQVTALAASSMRRNVSNMASNMAGLRPQSPRVSKGSLDLLLQQKQPNLRNEFPPIQSQREVAQREDVIRYDHNNRPERGTAQPDSSHRSLPDTNFADASQDMSHASKMATQAQTGSNHRQHIRELAPTADIRTVTQPQQELSHSGSQRALESEPRRISHDTRDPELLPNSKRHRSNKSDISNMLSNDQSIPTEENRFRERENVAPKPLTVEERPVLQPPVSMVINHVLQSRHSDDPEHSRRSADSFVLQQRFPDTLHNLALGAAPDQAPRTVGGDSLPLPYGLRTSDKGAGHSRHAPGDLPISNMPYRSAVPEPRLGAQMSRDDPGSGLVPQVRGGNSTHHRYGDNIRMGPPSFTNSTAERISTERRWTDSADMGTPSHRDDIGTAGVANQQWSAPSSDPRSAMPDHTYDMRMNRFVTTERRPRRLMPYVPTATRKAQFEQGRALAFIDSSPVPPSADPSAFRVDDGLTRMAPRSFPNRQEGSYRLDGDQYSYPQDSRDGGYRTVENQAPSQPFHNDYYSNRRAPDRRSTVDRPHDQLGRFVSHGVGEAPHARLGTEQVTRSGGSLGLQRPDVLDVPRTSSRIPIEPPIDLRVGSVLDRVEAPPMGQLVDPRIAPHSDKEILQMPSTFEARERFSDMRGRSRMGPGVTPYGTHTHNIGNSTRGRGDLVDPRYGSFHSRGSRVDAVHPQMGGVMESRIPMPVHADRGPYLPRTAGEGPPRVSYGGNVGAASDRGAFEQQGNRTSGSYGYVRRESDMRSAMVGQRMTSYGGDKEEAGEDRVSNIPLVARFDNSRLGYADAASVGRRSEERGRTESRTGNGQRGEQQLPSLRTDPSLRHLLS